MEDEQQLETQSASPARITREYWQDTRRTNPLDGMPARYAVEVNVGSGVVVAAAGPLLSMRTTRAALSEHPYSDDAALVAELNARAGEFHHDAPPYHN